MGSAIAHRAVPPRSLAVAAGALTVGIVIGLLDSRPGWDDTGVTVALLVVAAAIAGALGGSRPWLWALLIGAPLPIIEVPVTGSWASLVGLLFAAIGASLGVLARRAIEPAERGT